MMKQEKPKPSVSKSFLQNVVFLVSINVLVKLLYVFGIDLVVQNRIGEANYGIYFTILNFLAVFQIVNDFGLQNFNNSHIASHNKLIHKYLPNILTAKLVLGVVFFIVTCAFGLIMGYVQKYPQVFLMLLACQFLVSLNLYLRSNVSALAFYKWDGVFSTLDKFLMLLILAYVIYSDGPFDLSLSTFVGAQLIAYILATIGLLFFIFPRVKFKLKFNLLYLRYIWKKSRLFAIAVFLMFLYTRLDALMIEKILQNGVAEAGKYAASYRLLDLSNMLGFLFATLLFPMFARHRSQLEECKKLHRMAFRTLIVIYWATVIALISRSSDILELLYTGYTPEWTVIFNFIIPATLAWGVIYTSGALLSSHEILKPQIKVFIAGVLANLILNAVLIPKYGVTGAAIATLVTQSFMAISIHVIALKYLKYKKLQFGAWMTVIFAGIALYFLSAQVTLAWPLVCLGIFVIISMVAILVGLLNIKTLKAVMR